MIRLQQVAKIYALGKVEVRALDGVTLTIGQGEFVALVGPSGCGKTTLLRIIAGLEAPDAGTVRLQRQSPSQPATALVFQGSSLLPWLKVVDNVAYGLWCQGMGRKERREKAQELLAKVGLSPFAEAYPHQLSEGMQQRAAIARSFAADPEVLLMDEPFSSLDEQNRLLLQDELLRVWQDTGKTVLFVTHSVEEALALADRVVVMSSAPGAVKADIAVPFPRPRSVLALRSEAAFGRLVYEIWEILQGEVLRARAQELGQWESVPGAF